MSEPRFDHPRLIADIGGTNARFGWVAGPDAPAMDFVFTVCDQAAGEACPVWPGQPMTAHWGFADPAAQVSDDPAQARKAFTAALAQITTRIRLFLSLPLDKLDSMIEVEPLNAIQEAGARILAGQTRGRVVVEITIGVDGIPKDPVVVTSKPVDAVEVVTSGSSARLRGGGCDLEVALVKP